MKREATDSLYRDMDSHALDVLRAELRATRAENHKLKAEVEFLTRQMEKAWSGLDEISNKYRFPVTV